MPETTNPQPDRYRQRPIEVDAIQWTGHNADALRAFAGIDFDTIDPADRTDDLDCDAQLLVEASHWVGIQPGDWVLKFEGYFIAKSDVPFRAVWEPASPSAPADRATLVEGPQTVTHNANELRRKLATAERIRENADFHLGQEMARRQVAENETARLRAELAAIPVPADRAALRDRIRRAFCEANGFAWGSDMLEPDEYGEVADMVLAVLPEPADRAAVLREAANGLAALGPLDSLVSAPAAWTEAIETLRRMADQIAEDELRRVAGEAPQPETQRCVCGAPVEWMDVDVAYGSGWIHSPGSDTPCLDARPAVVSQPGKEA